jgi:hypothetical protein
METNGAGGANRLKVRDSAGQEKCLEYNTQAANRNMHMWPCHNGYQQKFWFDPYHRLRSRLITSLCLDYHTGNRNVYLHPCHAFSNQRFYFKSMDEFLTLKGMETVATTKHHARLLYTGYLPNNCMSISTTADNNVKMNACHGKPSQLFYFSGRQGSLYRNIKNYKTNTCLHYDTNALAGGNIVMKTCHSGKQQKFALWKGLHIKSSFNPKVCMEYNKKTDNVFMTKCRADGSQEWFDEIKKAIHPTQMLAAPKSWDRARNMQTVYNGSGTPNASTTGYCLEIQPDNDLKMSPCAYKTKQQFFFKSANATRIQSPSDTHRCVTHGGSKLYMSYCKLTVKGQSGDDGKDQLFYFDELGHLRTKKDDLCVDYDYKVSDGAVSMKACHYGDAQRWDFISKAKAGLMQAMHYVPKTPETATNFWTLYRDHECMSYRAKTKAVIMAPCSTQSKARFFFTGEQLKSAADPTKCAEQKISDVSLFLRACHSGDSQKWAFDVSKRLKNRESNKCLEFAKASGAVAANMCNHAKDTQRWYYGNHSDRMVLAPSTAEEARALIDRSSKLCLEVDEQSLLKMERCVFGSPRQRFYYWGSQLKSKLNDKCLDFNNKDSSKVNLYMYQCSDNADSQKFYFTNERLRADKVSNSCMDYEHDGYMRMAVCDSTRKTQQFFFEREKPRSTMGGASQLKKVASACEVQDPTEKDRAYSSVYGGDEYGTGHARSSLKSPGAWFSQYSMPGEWLQMDLGQRKDVSGVVLLGDNTSGDRVTGYNVKLSTDGYVWTDVEGVYDGNSDGYTRTIGAFEQAIPARHVRITVLGWKGHIAARAGALLCEGTARSSASAAASLLAGSARQMGAGCYVFTKECPKFKSMEFKTWTRDFWGEKYRNASVDRDACLKLRKADHDLLCGTRTTEMMFVPPVSASRSV